MSDREIPSIFWIIVAVVAGLLAAFFYLSSVTAGWFNVSSSTVADSLYGTILWGIAMLSLHWGTRLPIRVVAWLFVVCAWPQWFDVVREAADNYATAHSPRWGVADYPVWGTDWALWGSEIALFVVPMAWIWLREKRW